MENDAAAKIAANPKYQKLIRVRGRYGWIMSGIMLVIYYGYIAAIAFDKELLARKLGEGVMTYGIPIGMGIIFATVILTGLYVRRANTEFDALTRDIVKESQR